MFHGIGYGFPVHEMAPQINYGDMKLSQMYLTNESSKVVVG